MDVIDYIRLLNQLKQQSLNRWGNIGSIESSIVEGSFQWLIDNLEIKRGIIQEADLSTAMDQFVTAVLDIINQNKGYQSKLNLFLSDLSTISKNTAEFHATTNRINIETLGVTNVQKAVVDEIMNQYLENGLNAHFAEPLRENIFRNILLGANMKDVKQSLNNYIIGEQDGSGKLGQYITQTAQQSVDSYTGAVNVQLKKEFTFTGYIISGSLIETSSKQCVYAVDHSNKGYLSFDEWKKVLEIARNNPKARLIPGTTIDNLPLQRLHWGCRHEFTPTIRK